MYQMHPRRAVEIKISPNPLGWPMASNLLGSDCIGDSLFPAKHGSVTKPVPGWGLMVLDDEGKPAPHGQLGSIVATLPLPYIPIPSSSSSP